MCNCDKIQNAILVPDKVTRVLICGSLCFAEIQYTGECYKVAIICELY